MKLMWKYTKKHKALLLLNLVGVLGFITVEIGIPTLFRRIVRHAGLPTLKGVIIETAFLMFLCTIAGFVGEIILSYCNSRISSNVIKDIREDIFTKTQGFSHPEYEQFGVSSLITSTTSDAFQIMVFLQQALRSAYTAPLMFIISFCVIVAQSGIMALAVAGTIPLILVGMIWISKKTGPISKDQQQTLDEVNLNLRESLTGLRVIRAFGNEEFQEDRFKSVNEKYSALSERLFKITGFAMPVFWATFNALMVVIIGIGAWQISLPASPIQVDALAAFVEYIFHVLYSFMLFSIIFVMYPRASVSANRIEKILNAVPTIDANIDGITSTDMHGTIEFDNVTFAYPGETEKPVLKNISFKGNPGETIAFIGSTGSGKSTLIQLIPRFYDVTEGRVLVNGEDVRNYSLTALRNKIGFIPQKAILFSGTIAENIRYGKHDADSLEIEEAVDISQAKEFIEDKPEQYDELIAEGGRNMSGGQKQRLAISRAVIRKPEVYIFDDSFSALDYITDVKLRAGLKEQTMDSCVLIVAQRVGTIMHADKILVLNEGEIVAEGTHKELLKTSSIYYDIASSQLSKEELQ